MFFPMGRPVESGSVGRRCPVAGDQEREQWDTRDPTVRRQRAWVPRIGRTRCDSLHILWVKISGNHFSFCTFHHFHPNGSSAILWRIRMSKTLP
jgi:hypothetical protein